MAEQYRGQFKSNDGVLYTAIISNDNYTGESEDIPYFESEGEIEISWDEVEKYDVIQGSEAKVRIISETDRRFIDMYTETPGSIRLDVYKNETPDDVEGIGTLYWSGCLDCEFYEEPYSVEKNYAVELTFTDFGILDRLKFDMTDVLPVTLQSIMERALTKTCIAETAFNETMIALNKTLSDIYIYTANFYDEDGEASTWKEVVEQILQPLSLRLIQRNGVLYIYDLHSLYNSTDADVIEWRGNNATLGVDKVFNNCKVTFSPYVNSTIIEDDFGVDVDTSDLGKTTDDVITFFKNPTADPADSAEGDKVFSLFLKPTFCEFTVTNGIPVSLRKVYGGEDVDCIASVYPLTGTGATLGDVYRVPSTMWNGSKRISRTRPELYTDTSLFKSKKVFIPVNGMSNECLVVNLPIFFDFRINPYDDYDASNNNAQLSNAWAILVDVCVFIRLYDEDGNVLYHYTNADLTLRNHSINNKGSWVSGDIETEPAGLYSNKGVAILQYYMPTDLYQTLEGQWLDCHQYACPDDYAIANNTVDPLIDKIPAGQYIPVPPTSGYIEIEVLNGIGMFYDYTGEYLDANPNATSHLGNDETYINYEWILYKAPEITLNRNYSPYTTLSADDIETNGLIDESAKEDLELDFTCGTPTDNLPLAKGAYCDEDMAEYHTFTRAGRTDTAEQLFIGTCFSQYAKRNTTLNGDVKIDTGALKAYTDPYITKRYVDGVGSDSGESANKFLMVSDVQKLSTDRSETKFVEFMKDIYTKK